MKSNNSLWLLFLEGDNKAFSALFRHYYSILHNYGTKISGNEILTEDCIQNLFIHLFENRTLFSHINNPNAYLFVSLRNAVLKQLKKSVRNEEFTSQIENELSFVFSPEDFLVQKESLLSNSSTLHVMLNGLSKREREVLYLKYYSELSNQEISEVMDITNQSVSNTLLKAMSKLREDSLKELLLKVIS